MTKTTVEMLDLYARVRTIEQAGQDETWEVDGGRRREYFDLQVEMHRLLGRQIWEALFIDVVRTGPLCQMLPRERARRHHGMNWPAQAS
jgi:hypothetical protein